MGKVLLCKFQQCFGAFTMLLSERSLETVLFRLDVTMFFGVPNFGNTSAMRAILFFENVINLKEILKISQKIPKKFFVFDIIASGLVALKCLY